MSKDNGNTDIGTNSKLDAIKEIIFGQTMQEYDQRFSNVEQLLQNKLKDQTSKTNASIKDIRKEIAEMRSTFEKQLHELRTETNKEIAELKEIKADRKVLKKYLIQLVENL